MRKTLCFVLLTMFAFGTIKAQDSTMVAHWPMDEGSGTTVTDVVGGNDGTIVGDNPPEWIPGGGLAFNDIDTNHVEVPYAAVLDFDINAFTVSMLVRYDTVPGATDRWFINGTHYHANMPDTVTGRRK